MQRNIANSKITMNPAVDLHQKGIYCNGKDRLLLHSNLNNVPMKKFICKVNKLRPSEGIPCTWDKCNANKTKLIILRLENAVNMNIQRVLKLGLFYIYNYSLRKSNRINYKGFTALCVSIPPHLSSSACFWAYFFRMRLLTHKQTNNPLLLHLICMEMHSQWFAFTIRI